MHKAPRTSNLSRRQLVQGAGVASFALLAACGQLVGQAQRKVYRVGWLGDRDSPGWYEAFRQGMREQGYIEGQTLLIEARLSDGQVGRHAELAAELAGLS